MESNLSKRWVNIQSKSSLLCLHKPDALSFLPGEPFCLASLPSTSNSSNKNCPARFWWSQDPGVDAEQHRASEPRSSDQYAAHSAQGATSTSLSRQGRLTDPQQRIAQQRISQACRWEREENNGFIRRSSSLPHPKNVLQIWEILWSGEELLACNIRCLPGKGTHLLDSLLQPALSLPRNEISNLRLKRITCNFYSWIKATYNCQYLWRGVTLFLCV